MSMPWPEFELEKGSVELAGENYPVSRVISFQKARIVDFQQGSVTISVWELLKERNQRNNPAFVQFLDGSWVRGYTKQRRWPAHRVRPERQTVFFSKDKNIPLSFVISSIQISA